MGGVAGLGPGALAQALQPQLLGYHLLAHVFGQGRQERRVDACNEKINSFKLFDNFDT